MPSAPKPPEAWPTGLRYWLRREGLLFGFYWAVRARQINAAEQDAYLRRRDDWMKEVAETLWEAPHPYAELGVRERQIMEMTDAGQSDEDIAAFLDVSVNRVQVVRRGARAFLSQGGGR